MFIRITDFGKQMRFGAVALDHSSLKGNHRFLPYTGFAAYAEGFVNPLYPMVII